MGGAVTCRELNDFLDDYESGELAAGERMRFEWHLAACRHCLAFLDSYRRTVRLGRTLCDDPEGPTPPEVPEDLVRAILAARPSAHR
jgi:anti-sigma factor RsiW